VKNKLSILLLEDVVADAALIGHELEKGGLSARPTRVETREEFLSELEKHRPDVILSDHGLPSFDGFTALKEARKRCPEIPFIFVAQAHGPEEVIRSYEGGATNFVLKHELSGRLVPVIREALQKKPENRRTETTSNTQQLAALLNEAEQRCRQRTADLDAAVKELDAFSYSVSHDLRAPLRHIDGFVEMLNQRLRAQGDTTTQEYLGIISSAAKQMGTLIDALLSFSRTSRAPLFHSRVALDKVVQSVTRDLHFETEGRDVQWKIDPLPTVDGDPTLLRQAFFNLISNALKFTRPQNPARIEIAAEERPAEWLLHVRDNGVGFDMQYAGKLFGVFQRLHPPSEFEGIGIGLANVRRIIQRHGGRIWAEARPGEGAVFYFSLPREAT
jgi:signal transduction histidine kinase